MSDLIPTSVLPLLSLPPSQYCQAYFVILGTGCLALQLLPSLHDALLSYGPRKAQDAGSPAPDATATSPNVLVKLLGRSGLLLRVPHAWFTHFYIALLALQVFWAVQFATGGRVLTAVASREIESGLGSGLSLGQILIGWAMLSFQGVRRLYECLFIMKPSSSPMLAIHWVLSMLVYVFMSTSIWIEGSASLLGLYSQPGAEIPIFRAIAALILFGMASAAQHEAHLHLASLKKYTLPHDGLFRYIACPHYTCECLIYVALALVTAPASSAFNRTMLSAVFFVLANLGATANSTKKWYAEKFGADKAPRWRMVPFLF